MKADGFIIIAQALIQDAQIIPDLSQVSGIVDDIEY